MVSCLGYPHCSTYIRPGIIPLHRGGTKAHQESIQGNMSIGHQEAARFVCCLAYAPDVPKVFLPELLQGSLPLWGKSK
jgi:hypothetical protein